MTSIPADKITPGYYECRTRYGHQVLVRVHRVDGETELFVDAPNCDDTALSEWSTVWQFTARYVRCDGEPVDCRATYVDGDWQQADLPTALPPLLCGGKLSFVRGLFIPTEPTPMTDILTPAEEALLATLKSEPRVTALIERLCGEIVRVTAERDRLQRYADNVERMKRRDRKRGART